MGSINGAGGTPDIGVMVQNPAACAVMGLGHLASSFGHIFHQLHQRQEGLGEIGNIGQPVIHLQIDVDGVFAAPGRKDIFIPNALEIGRLRAGSGTGNGKVAAILQVERGQ